MTYSSTRHRLPVMWIVIGAIIVSPCNVAHANCWAKIEELPTATVDLVPPNGDLPTGFLVHVKGKRSHNLESLYVGLTGRGGSPLL